MKGFGRPVCTAGHRGDAASYSQREGDTPRMVPSSVERSSQFLKPMGENPTTQAWEVIAAKLTPSPRVARAAKAS